MMKFGIHNPSFNFPNRKVYIFDDLKEKAHWAETHGFVWFDIMDHMIQIAPGVGAADDPFMEGWTTLAALAAITEKMRLGTMVTSVSYRNPALLAKMGATVDNISHGRLTLSIGAGWYEDEYHQYGWDFLPASTRIHQMEEAVQVIKAMWTQPRANFSGRYFQVRDAILEPKPIQKPHPPILIGGSGEQLTLRVVARHADACNLFGNPQEVAQKLDVLRRHCDTEKRDFNEIERTCLSTFLLARDDATLKEKSERLGVPGTSRGFALTTAQAVDLLTEYDKAGIQMIVCSIHKNDEETQELLAELIPHFG